MEQQREMEIPQEEDLIYALDIGTRSVIGMLGKVKEGKVHIFAMEKQPHQQRAMQDGQIEDIGQAARAVVQIQNAAESRIAMLKNEGFLCMGVSYWGLRMVTQILTAFKERFPDLTLRLFVNDYAHLKSMMQAGQIDLAVISVTEDDDLPPQGCIHFCREELVLALPKRAPFCLAHPRKSVIPAAELPEILDTISFISPDEGASIRRTEDKLFEQLLYRPNVLCEVEREDSASRMVAAGAGAAILSAEDVRNMEQIRIFHLKPPLYRENILVRRQGAEQADAIQTLEDLLMSQAETV